MYNCSIKVRQLTPSHLPELHDQVHEGGRCGVRLLGRAHGGLQEVLDGDLVPQRLVEQPLAGRQLAVGQDLNLPEEEWGGGGQAWVRGRMTNE